MALDFRYNGHGFKPQCGQILAGQLFHRFWFFLVLVRHVLHVNWVEEIGLGGWVGGWLSPGRGPNYPPPPGSLSNSLDKVLVRINVQNFTNTQSRTVHIRLADIHLRD